MSQSTVPTQFHPTSFLAALGAGGISVAPFAIMQYAMPHHIAGLITHQAVTTQAVGYSSGLVATLELVMVFFGALHFILMGWLGKAMFTRFQLGNPLQSSSLLAPLLALAMSFNVIIGSVRFFWPALNHNLQAIMPYAFVAWMLLFVFTFITAGLLLKRAFTNRSNLTNAPYGWMQYPLSIAMISVTGMGFASLSNSAGLAHTAFIVSLLGLASAGVFLVIYLVIRMRHPDNPASTEDKLNIPSLIAIIPIVSLYGVAAYRIPDYLRNNLYLEAHWLATFGIATLFMLQFFLLARMFGLLNSFLKRALVKDEYYPSLWALVCPMVGFAVLSAFTNSALTQNYLFTVLAFIALAAAIALYIMLLRRMLACKGLMPCRATPQCA